MNGAYTIADTQSNKSKAVAQDLIEKVKSILVQDLDMNTSSISHYVYFTVGFSYFGNLIDKDL